MVSRNLFRFCKLVFSTERVVLVLLIFQVRDHTLALVLTQYYYFCKKVDLK